MGSHPFEALPFFLIAGKEFCDDGDLSWLQAHSCRITRTAGVHPIAIWCMRPRQQTPRLILLSPSSPHALSDQTPFILSNSPTDLQQELIVRILTHGSINKFHLASCSFEFLNKEHLMNIITSQPIRGSDDQ